MEEMAIIKRGYIEEECRYCDYILKDDLKTILLNMITNIINTTQPTPVFKKNFQWNIYDCERLYKTQPLYYLLNLIEGKEE